MTSTLRILCVVAALSYALPGAAKGSAEDGAAKAATCLACHGANGNSVNAEWPSLAGQNAAYIIKQLKMYHGGMRTGDPKNANSALMPPMAAPLSDQDMEDIAAYYSVQTPTGNEADPALWEAGAKLYRGGDRARNIPACAACHGPLGSGNPAAGYPALRAQHVNYTTRQLNDFRAQQRYTKNDKGASNGGDNAAIMQTIATRLSPDDIRALAAYLQGMR
jgi:cytochrome c553